MSTRILIADDHQLMREGLRSILEAERELEVVGEAESGQMAIEQVGALRPDIVVMDIAMRDLNGIEATRQIRARWPETRVIALSSHAERRYVTAVLEAGADGYVLKAGAFEDLRRAVEAVRAGKRFLCADVTGAVVDAGVGRPSTEPSDAAARGASPFDVLRPREREVLQLIAEGLSTTAVAARLSISPHTVDTHRRNLMRKLGIHNVADLTRYAIREGLTSADR